MTKDEIIKLAQASGIDVSLYDMGAASCVFSEGCHGVARSEFQNFARACYEAGRTAEREVCAKLCEAMINQGGGRGWNQASVFFAAAIRARGKP